MLFRASASIALTIASIAIPSGIAAQGTASYDVPGISAWSTSKTYGFEFRPEASSGESVTRPLDGMNTRLTKSVTKLFITSKVAVAQVVGGQPSVMPNERNTTFTFFGGRTLQPGWTVKSVDVGGNFVYVQQPRLNTSDLSFRVRLAPGGSATLRKVVLNGPSGADWKEAFSAPVRKDYVINGTVAWNAAKKYGFTFKPLVEGSNHPGAGYIYGDPDGDYTALLTQAQLTFSTRCTSLPNSSPRDGRGVCIIGQIAGGNMSVPVPIYSSTLRHAAAFEMFGGKKLSPGWTVKAVDVSNGTWVRQAQSGTGDLSFVLRVSSNQNNAGISIVRTITLEGPSNAASFEDAFRNAQNP